MSEIVASVKRVHDIIGEISAASAEQSRSISSVDAAVSELDRMTQQNAALVEESAAAAESLKQQSRQLAGVVDSFGSGHRTRSSPAAGTATPALVATQAIAHARAGSGSVPVQRAAVATLKAPQRKPLNDAAVQTGLQSMRKLKRPPVSHAPRPVSAAAAPIAAGTAAAPRLSHGCSETALSPAAASTGAMKPSGKASEGRLQTPL